MPLFRLFAGDIQTLRGSTWDPEAGPERERVARLGDRAARSALPVLIEGEPGSGASTLARAIHTCSDRRARPFITFRAGDDLLEPGGPDAVIARKLHEADGGTLFIQDVDRLSQDGQRRLLEALCSQDQALRAARRAIRPDARIVASTGFGLSEKVRSGSFREDLFYRFQALPITLRPLRAQREAIGGLAAYFISCFAADEGRPAKNLTSEALTLLTLYQWPGNLRQLANVVYRATVLVEGPRLTPVEFPQIAAHAEGFRVAVPPVPAPRALAPVQDNAPVAARGPDALSLIGDNGEVRTLADLEAQAIRFALLHYQGHMSAVSRHLGIGRSTLYRKLKELGLDDEAA